MYMVSRTDIGNIRLVNEDRAFVRHEPDGWSVAVIADGMGAIKPATSPARWRWTRSSGSSGSSRRRCR
ncbi:hypothetical protein [Gordoniibacillus kamchatkensis]|uniref:hypothetical protein n=1 Tax=Gordoniibacillus kamchatkensis TaxID=1590651 RepID=UPI000AF53547